MAVLGKPKTVETIVKLENIDPVTCKEFFKGEVDEQGSCLIRVRLDKDKAELQEIKYVPPIGSFRAPLPTKEEKT
jgi:hypothetical protein